jgi:aspartate/methionine/tyrosine aminotransferase
MSSITQRIKDFDPTIFEEMADLAHQHSAINLGQDFPDMPPPDFLKHAAARAVRDDLPPGERPRLREVIARKIARRHGLPIDPSAEILVTSGATTALATAILALVNPGDEVILFEPYYHTYLPLVQMAGGIPRFHTLQPPDWSLQPEGLARLFSQKTRLLLLNTPHNPTGKVYSEKELELIADLCQRYNVITVSDEVYEHLVFDGRRHQPLATLPGMTARTITISGAGATFNVPGWNVGWATAAPKLLHLLSRVHQLLAAPSPAPLQEAVTAALRVPDDYYTTLAAMYQEHRDLLLNALYRAGLRPLTPQGAYFIMVDIHQQKQNFSDSAAFCHHLVTKIGVAAMPATPFYYDPRDGAKLVRFSFCKPRPILEEAARRLEQLGEGVH